MKDLGGPSYREVPVPSPRSIMGLKGGIEDRGPGGPGTWDLGSIDHLLLTYTVALLYPVSRIPLFLQLHTSSEMPTYTRDYDRCFNWEQSAYVSN